MTISREDVLYVASLAHLELSEGEVESFRKQLDGILSYIDKLKQIDVSQVEPMAQVLHQAARSGAELREDMVLRKSDIAKEVLKQASEAESPFFRVPKVIDR